MRTTHTRLQITRRNIITFNNDNNKLHILRQILKFNLENYVEIKQMKQRKSMQNLKQLILLQYIRLYPKRIILLQSLY